MGNGEVVHKASYKSTSGAVIQLNYNCKVFNSKKQATVLRLSTESELYAILQTLTDVSFLVKLF
jgi:hypothetical protein